MDKKIKELKDLVDGLLGIPSFTYVDLGTGSGLIIIRSFFTEVSKIWSKMAELDDKLTMFLDADIIRMKVDFTTEVSSAWEMKFEINFQYD